jgi:anti-anti-sigma factor
VAATAPPPAGPDYAVRFGPTTALRREGSRTVVALRGDWDVFTRARLAEVLSRVIASGGDDVVIDLAGGEFIDTATVRALIDARQLLNSRGRAMSFRSPSGVAARVLAVFGLTHLIEGQPTEARSNEACPRPPSPEERSP